jgi:hypothetical protein
MCHYIDTSCIRLKLFHGLERVRFWKVVGLETYLAHRWQDGKSEMFAILPRRDAADDVRTIGNGFFCICCSL